MFWEGASFSRYVHRASDARGQNPADSDFSLSSLFLWAPGRGRRGTPGSLGPTVQTGSSGLGFCSHCWAHLCTPSGPAGGGHLPREGVCFPVPLPGSLTRQKAVPGHAPHTFHPPLCRPGSPAKMLTDKQREHSRHSAPQGTLHLFSAPDWTHPGEQGALSPSSVAEAGRKVSSSRWGGYQAPLALTSLVPQVRLGGVATE